MVLSRTGMVRQARHTNKKTGGKPNVDSFTWVRGEDWNRRAVFSVVDLRICYASFRYALLRQSFFGDSILSISMESLHSLLQAT
jgi:hypothetical protein